MQTIAERQGTRQERAAEYRRLAEEAEKLASLTVFPDDRRNYLRYAHHWRDLARETEGKISFNQR